MTIENDLTIALTAYQIEEGMSEDDLSSLLNQGITLPMRYDQIKEYMPHRYPFMLVDRVTACCPQKSITGYKNVTINEPFFEGHFPDEPIMPGVLIVEAMAQLSGVLACVFRGHKTESNCLFLFGGADKVRFRKPVVSGDTLVLRAQLDTVKSDIFKFVCQAKVDDQLVASAKIMLVLQRRQGST